MEYWSLLNLCSKIYFISFSTIFTPSIFRAQSTTTIFVRSSLLYLNSLTCITGELIWIELTNASLRFYKLLVFPQLIMIPVIFELETLPLIVSICVKWPNWISEKRFLGGFWIARFFNYSWTYLFRFGRGVKFKPSVKSANDDCWLVLKAKDWPGIKFSTHIQFN